MSPLVCELHIGKQEAAMSASMTAVAAALLFLIVLPVSADAQLRPPQIMSVEVGAPRFRLRLDKETLERASVRGFRFPAAQAATSRRSWIRRHPVLFGALVGFGSGFLIGYTAGDDGVFDDFTAGFNGWVMGGIGAGAGAAVGAVVAIRSD
jgi:hypothetical protein